QKITAAVQTAAVQSKGASDSKSNSSAPTKAAAPPSGAGGSNAVAVVKTSTTGSTHASGENPLTTAGLTRQRKKLRTEASESSSSTDLSELLGDRGNSMDVTSDSEDEEYDEMNTAISGDVTIIQSGT